ncbi:hypothetical protein GF366_01060 [Candidatus Peregrinibacteria bacterium]|nr:hypothetical protein [Candidatus Peregrinibacteria bacterium]
MGTKGNERDNTTVDVVEGVEMVVNGDAIDVEVDLSRKSTKDSTRRILDLLRDRRGSEGKIDSSMRVRKDERVRGLLRSRRSRRSPKDPSK